MDVYPSRRKIWSSICVSAALLLIGIVAAGAVVAHRAGTRDWIAFPAVALFAWMLVLCIRELRNPIALARLDADGLECALGRVPWTNVSAVSVRWHWRSKYPSRRVFFDLRSPATDLVAPTREYLSRSPFGGPFQTGTEIDLPLWDSTQRVVGDVRRYHPIA